MILSGWLTIHEHPYVYLWNIAALGKYVWAVENKIDNLWVKWMDDVYIEQDICWDHVQKSTSSWY